MNARSRGRAPREASLRCGLDKRLARPKGCLGPRCSGLEPQCQRPGAEGSGRTGRGLGQPSRRRRVRAGRVRARPPGRRGTRDAAVASGAPPRGEDRRAGQRRAPHAGEGWSSAPRAASQPGEGPLPRGREAAGQERVPGEALPAALATGKGSKADFPQRSVCPAPSGRKSGAGEKKQRVNQREIRSPLSGLSFIPAPMTSHGLFLNRV